MCRCAGVTTGILPWNFPFFLIARKAAPALITGNTIVIKPSEITPNNAIIFAEIIHNIGLPKGVLNIVTGFGPTVGQELDMGPLISAAALQRVEDKVAKAVSQGAKVLIGGQRAGGTGYFYPPTLLVDVKQDMPIMHEEVFGPVLPVATFATLEEAMAMANDSEYGLTSSIYTQNINTAMQALKQLKFGETYINRENFEAMQGFHAGWRKSGVGGADGKHGLQEYLQTHVAYLQFH
ncbi:aldehyde dehydrogenase family protein [Brenneria nigrifluens DSM 30175 = ATCC 13028]|uniref:Aldehyde dehydrogenase n=1 Tax=Brenneria nigrifluens DSM 30175 = ATCC 13028 TaxID=1121120 RepID=A0A2U1UNV6_9GAMM|nr:aldehyde dehydrogenase [Brenneria nigrifluens] [Brenneria nigrifluens DSM 30175 = ATCC 13028]QCR06774.1 aldehyde dehydrogenase family protein [Brenneria nigrifluens DSM 30175 = ATCC 13028]